MADDRDGPVNSPAQRENTSSVVVEHLRNAIRQAIKDPETAEIVELLCDNNGWTLDDFLLRPHELTSMELFLLSLPHLPQLRLFPYLTVLRIINVGLDNMEGLSYLHHVEELWLSENRITTIKGLENMNRLKKLFLHGNMIESMDGLPLLPQLRRLWLCDNFLTRISSLEKLPKLRSLWVASNRIATLEKTFTSNTTLLDELNLANNQIYFFGQLDHLCVLKSLRSLWLSDPMYGDAPMCRLSNYTTFSIQRLPHLEQLDGVVITREQRSLAVSVYAKKRIYYSMRGTILSRNVSMLLRYVQQLAEDRREIARDALRRIDWEIAQLSRSNDDSNGPSGVSSPTGDAEAHVSKLKRAMETREVELEEIERQLVDAHKRTVYETDSLQERLLMELHSCGNIRLEEGNSEDNWYANAKDLVCSRFDAKLYEAMGITGVKVNRVFRITCQGLRERFDGRMRELDIDLADTRTRRALVRLFSPVCKCTQDQRNFINEVMTNGFTSLYSDDVGVPLTNSLYYADQERLVALNNNRDNLYGVTVQQDALSGQLVLSRLFLGKSVAEMGGRLDPSTNAEEQAIFVRSDRRNVSRRHYGKEVFSIYRSAPHDSSVKVWHMFDKCLLLPEYVIDFTYSTKAHLSISPALSIFDSPEIIQRLISEAIPDGATEDLCDIRSVGYPLVAFLNWLTTSTFRSFAEEETKSVLSRATEIRQARGPFHPTGSLTNDAIVVYKKQCHMAPGTEMLFCDLSERHITCIRENFSTLLWLSLKTLILRDNSITTVAWGALSEAAPVLEHLDISGNLLEHADISATFHSLRVLRLTHNKLHVLEDVLCVAKASPVLEEFFMDHNPWVQEMSYEVFILSAMPQLRSLNGVRVSRHARLAMMRRRTFNLDLGALSYIVAEQQRRLEKYGSYTLFIEYSDDSNGSNISEPNSTTTNEERSFNSASTNSKSSSTELDIIRVRCFEEVFRDLEELSETRRAALLVDREENSISLLRSAQSFVFRCSLMRDLSWVSWLPNLNHLSLTSHVIDDITPLADLRYLRTLDLTDNAIRSVSPLGKMRWLTSLNLSQNKICNIDGLENLSALRFLSISRNFVTSLTSLHKCKSLEELYCAGNAIEEVRDLYQLHRLQNLVSLDVLGNPCSSRNSESAHAEYRNYLVYNLPKLKVLDGVPINEAEQQCARDLFTGRVNTELLIDRVDTVQTQWGSVAELDLSHCSLREVMMMESFVRLKVLHLHHNSLVRIDGLSPLTTLVALNLSHNRLGQCRVGDTLRHIHSLQSLSLESNHITDVGALGLALPRLLFLNLKGNEISSIDQDLRHLTDLRELLLDNNKLRQLGPDCFANNLQLIDISADENYIRSTEGLQSLEGLVRLSLGSNRLGDLRSLLMDLRGCCALTTATFIGNSIVRKTPYRTQVISALPSITVLDGKEISDEERERADMMKAVEYTTPPNVMLEPTFSVEAVLNGVRVTGAAGGPPRVPLAQAPRFPLAGNVRLQLPAYKVNRADPSRGFVPRLQNNGR